MGGMCVGSLNSSIVRISPVSINFTRAGSESTFGVVISATPLGASKRTTLWRKPMGLSTRSMTSLAVTKSKEARPSAEAKSFWSKSSGAWGAWVSYHSEVRSTARKSLPKDWSGRSMAPGPHRSSAARMPDHAYLASTRSATNPLVGRRMHLKQSVVYNRGESRARVCIRYLHQ